MCEVIEDDSGLDLDLDNPSVLRIVVEGEDGQLHLPFDDEDVVKLVVDNQMTQLAPEKQTPSKRKSLTRFFEQYEIERIRPAMAGLD